MLLALRKPVASPTQDGVTVSFSSGPNLVSYDYTVACYAQDPAVPTTDCGAVAAEGTAPVVTPVTGTLPRGYAEVIVPVTLTGNEAVDCLVTVSGGPIDKLTKCQYAEAADAPTPGPTPDDGPTGLLVANFDGASVSTCTLGDDGVDGCANAGPSTISGPQGVAISPDASVAYVVDFNDGSVVACAMDGDGYLSACVETADPTFSDPHGIAVSVGGTSVYVVNGGASQGDEMVTKCTVQGTAVTNCGAMGPGPSDAPSLATGIAISGGTMFVTQIDAGAVDACLFDSTGTAADLDCCIRSVLPTGTVPYDIAISGDGSTAYITDVANNAVVKCDVDGDGTSQGQSLTNCAAMTVTGATLNFPTGAS